MGDAYTQMTAMHTFAQKTHYIYLCIIAIYICIAICENRGIGGSNLHWRGCPSLFQWLSTIDQWHHVTESKEY